MLQRNVSRWKAWEEDLAHLFFGGTWEVCTAISRGKGYEAWSEPFGSCLRTRDPIWTSVAVQLRGPCTVLQHSELLLVPAAIFSREGSSTSIMQCLHEVTESRQASQPHFRTHKDAHNLWPQLKIQNNGKAEAHSFSSPLSGDEPVTTVSETGEQASIVTVITVDSRLRTRSRAVHDGAARSSTVGAEG